MSLQSQSARNTSPAALSWSSLIGQLDEMHSVFCTYTLCFPHNRNLFLRSKKAPPLPESLRLVAELLYFPSAVPLRHSAQVLLLLASVLPSGCGCNCKRCQCGGNQNNCKRILGFRRAADVLCTIAAASAAAIGIRGVAGIAAVAGGGVFPVTTSP